MKARKLLSISGAVVITLAGGAAAATGNLMAPPRKDPSPTDKVADAGSKAETTVPLQKKEAKKDAAKQ